MTDEPPIACQLGVLTPAQRDRQRHLLENARAKVLATSELTNGYALRFPSDPGTVLELAEWINLEHRCCAFAEFAIEWRKDASVWVRLTGNPVAKEVLAAEMGLATVSEGAGRERSSDQGVASRNG